MKDENGQIEICLKIPNNGAAVIKKRYLFQLPYESINAVFMGEECSGIEVEYKWDHRYKCYLFYSSKTFCGN